MMFCLPWGAWARDGAAGDAGESRASALLQAAIAHRRAGEWETGVKELRRAYALSPQPSYLVLIGDVEQDAGHSQEALAAYQRYLKLVPQALDRIYVQEQIDNLQQPQAAPPRRPKPQGPLVVPGNELPAPPPQVPVPLLLSPPPPSALSAPPAAVLTAPAEPEGRWRPSRTVWILGAVGVAVVAGLAIGLGVGLRPAQPTFVVAPGAVQ